MKVCWKKMLFVLIVVVITKKWKWWIEISRMSVLMSRFFFTKCLLVSLHFFKLIRHLLIISFVHSLSFILFALMFYIFRILAHSSIFLIMYTFWILFILVFIITIIIFLLIFRSIRIMLFIHILILLLLQGFIRVFLPQFFLIVLII